MFAEVNGTSIYFDAEGSEYVGRGRVPTLVIGGRHDGISPPTQSERIHQAIPGSQLTVFENSGHSQFIEEQKGFNALMAEFVAGGAHVS